MGTTASGLQDLMPQLLDEQTVLSMTKDVPIALLKESILTGTPAEVVDQMAVWRDHGLRYAVVCNASAMQPSLYRGLKAMVPFAKIIHRLGRL